MEENQSNEHKKLDHSDIVTIPYNVLNDKELCDGAKVCLCLIMSFVDNQGDFNITNDQLGNILGRSKNTISKYSTELKRGGYIITKHGSSTKTANVFRPRGVK